VKISAGIIYFKFTGKNEPDIFLAHSTGKFPFYSFPKGEVEQNEELFETALREFEEETSHKPVSNNKEDYYFLGSIQQGKKTVFAFAIEADINAECCESNECEYPIGTGIMIKELDKYAWFSYQEALVVINPNQIPLLEILLEKVR